MRISKTKSKGWSLCLLLLLTTFLSLTAAAQGPWVVIHKKLSVFEAQSKCQSWGGHLVYVNSRSELDSVHKLIERFYPDSFPFWIGAHYDNQSRHFQWYDKKQMTFKNWRPGEPNNNNGLEFYVEMTRDKTWNDIAAVRSYPFICKRKKPNDCYYGVGETYGGPSSFTRDGVECLKWNVVNWGKYRWNDNYCRNPDENKHGPWCFPSMNRNPAVCNVTKCVKIPPNCKRGFLCSHLNMLLKERQKKLECSYRFQFTVPDYHFERSQLPFDPAEAFCKAKGMHLASVMTLEENTKAWLEAKKLGSEFVWLGGTDNNGDGEWQWIDGEYFTFIRWSIKGNEANIPGGARYLAMSAGTGFWYQVSKFHLLPSVCESIGVRLSVSEIPFLGKVEIYYKGAWMPVCNEEWDKNVARIACRERGFKDVIETFQSRSQDMTSTALVLDTNDCTGQESSIISCATFSKGDNMCRPLWVICKDRLNFKYQSNHLAIHGDEIKQQCVLSGEEFVGWFDGYGQAVPESGRVAVMSSETGNQKKYFLHVLNVQPDDGGIYFCKGRNKIKMFKFFLKFDAGSIQRVQYISKKKTGSLHCNVKGYPKSVITWQKEGSPIEGSRFKVTFFGSLRMENATEKDLGLYTCAVTQQVPLTINSKSQTFTESFGIEVRMAERPVFKHSTLTTLIVAFGSNVTLTCKADGKPRPQYRWFTSSGKELRGNQLIKVDGGNLTIFLTRREDLDTYLCKAQNSAGEAAATFELVNVEESSTSHTGYIVAGCVSGVLVFVVAITFGVRYQRLRTTTLCEIPKGKSRTRMSSRDLQPNLLSPHPGHSLRYALPPGYNSGHNSLRSLQDLFNPGVELEPLEYHRDCIHIERQIGKGAFGEVSRAVLIDILEGKIEKRIVAVKSIRGAPDEFDKELELRKTLVSEPHSHIVNLLGFVKKSQPMLMILEYVPFGDLLGYLRQSRGVQDLYYSRDEEQEAKDSGAHHLSPLELLSFARQIANGMRFLASKMIIHGDLAARNVLVGENQICKITDFGLAQMAMEQDGYTRRSKGRLPIKWSAPEVIFADSPFRVTSKSDVWSFGVLLYEIFTVGGTPYPEWDAIKVIENLRLQYRMERPQHVGEHLYEIMLGCWRQHPDKRPSFKELDQNISQMVEEEHYLDLDMNRYDGTLYNEVEDLPGSKNDQPDDEVTDEGFL